jgi:hypothetical protein
MSFSKKQSNAVVTTPTKKLFINSFRHALVEAFDDSTIPTYPRPSCA